MQASFCKIVFTSKLYRHEPPETIGFGGFFVSLKEFILLLLSKIKCLGEPDPNFDKFEGGFCSFILQDPPFFNVKSQKEEF